MTTDNKPLAAPKDNLLGICNALGQDFGFDPLWLRLALGAAFVIQPAGVVVSYLALGLLVLVSRLAFPNPRKLEPQAVVAEPAIVALAEVAEQQSFAKAA